MYPPYGMSLADVVNENGGPSVVRFLFKAKRLQGFFGFTFTSSDDDTKELLFEINPENRNGLEDNYKVGFKPITLDDGSVYVVREFYQSDLLYMIRDGKVGIYRLLNPETSVKIDSEVEIDPEHDPRLDLMFRIQGMNNGRIITDLVEGYEIRTVYQDWLTCGYENIRVSQETSYDDLPLSANKEFNQPFNK